MEMEYRDPAKRGKFIVVVGIVLALAAGGAAFYLINKAQQQAVQSTLQKPTWSSPAGASRPQAGRGQRRRGPSDPARPDELRRIRDQDA